MSYRICADSHSQILWQICSTLDASMLSQAAQDHVLHGDQNHVGHKQRVVVPSGMHVWALQFPQQQPVTTKANNNFASWFTCWTERHRQDPALGRSPGTHLEHHCLTCAVIAGGLKAPCCSYSSCECCTRNMTQQHLRDGVCVHEYFWPAALR